MLKPIVRNGGMFLAFCLCYGQAPDKAPAVQQVLSELSSGFAIASQYGFLGLAVDQPSPPSGTAPGNTVEFDVTHAFDPGPRVTNANVMPPGQPYDSADCSKRSAKSTQAERST